MSIRAWSPVMVAALSIANAQYAWGAEKKPFAVLRSPAISAARIQAEQWLRTTGKTDEASQKRFVAIWGDNDRSVLDRVAGTFALGDAGAAKVLADARDLRQPASQEAPSVLTDVSKPAYFRSNLGLAYARALAERRDYEQALAILRIVKPEEVVDPAAYFFDRAVAEHAMAEKTEAARSIVGLIEDVAEVPDRYRVLALLMYQDMQDWEDKDLGDIARKMDNIERRLTLARGGPKTQKLQREVVSRLDELIKKLEQGGC